MNPSKCLLHRRQGVPLKGPFLGHFSQGNLSKVNEIVHFSDFRMFCFLSPISRCSLGSQIHSIFHPDGMFLMDFPNWKRTKNGGRRYQRLPPIIWMQARVPTQSRNAAKIAFEKGLLVLVSSTHHCASTPSLSTSWSLTAR